MRHAIPERTEKALLPHVEIHTEAAADDGQHRHENDDEEQSAEPTHDPTPEDEGGGERIPECCHSRCRECGDALEERICRREMQPRQMKRQHTEYGE